TGEPDVPHKVEPCLTQSLSEQANPDSLSDTISQGTASTSRYLTLMNASATPGENGGTRCAFSRLRGTTALPGCDSRHHDIPFRRRTKWAITSRHTHAISIFLFRHRRKCSALRRRTK